MSDENGHVIICGFGVPGRAVAEWLDARHTRHTVIETNAITCDRAVKAGRLMIEGDATDPAILNAAGIARASMIVVAIPDQATALKVVKAARELNGTVPIIARTRFISGGFEARKLGADFAIVEEQVVGQEFVRVLDERIASLAASHENPVSQ